MKIKTSNTNIGATLLKSADLFSFIQNDRKLWDGNVVTLARGELSWSLCWSLGSGVMNGTEMLHSPHN